jgi:hypothetical protein
VGREDVIDILLNWDDCELSEDGNKIIQHVGRDREYSRGKMGGATRRFRGRGNWAVSFRSDGCASRSCSGSTPGL